jgi:adenylyltransferase/sulfurtransferase
MLSISVKDLQQKLRDKEDIVLIDVREPWEHELFNIGGTLIPLQTIVENTERIGKEKPVVFYCQKGIRSQIAIQRLQQKYNYTNLINLSGGMEAWKMEEDRSI